MFKDPTTYPQVLFKNIYLLKIKIKGRLKDKSASLWISVFRQLQKVTSVGKRYINISMPISHEREWVERRGAGEGGGGEKKRRKEKEKKKKKKHAIFTIHPSEACCATTANVLLSSSSHSTPPLTPTRTPPGDISPRRHCDECPWSWEYFQSGAVGGSPCLECPKWKRPQSAGAVGHPEIAPIRFWSPGDRNRHETLGCWHLGTHRQAGDPVALMAYCHRQ